MPLLRRWADLLDSKFRIPGTNIRFGLDPILSLIPGLGEIVTPVFALALLAHGVAVGVPRIVLVRMLLNALVDAALGAVPIAGNVADLFWRANVANLRLLERSAQPGHRATRGDYAFVFAIAGTFGAFVFLVVGLAVWIGLSFWNMLA